jgi:hypothetical protein
MGQRLKIAALNGLGAFALVLALAGPASAGIGSAVLSDCNAHDALTKTYTVAELRNALATMPATMREYTDCQDVISRALNTALGNGGKSNGASASSGGSSLSTGVIVVIVVLALVAATLGAIAIRRRRAP